MTVSKWADKYRILSRTASAEAGKWRTDRTPYLRKPMDDFNDPAVKRIVIAAAAQVGKSELELNTLAYIIGQNMGGTILYVHPTLEEAKKFSRLRIEPMFKDTPAIAGRLGDMKDSSKTTIQKSFPGGMLMLVGSNSPAALASTPARYIIADERDRWALSAGKEGDPLRLAIARTTTFYNSKIIEVSTPTTKGASPIEDSYMLGTQEEWCYKCPHCGEYVNIKFRHIKFDYVQHDAKTPLGSNTFTVSNIRFVCPECGALSTEREMRRQPAKWVARNPNPSPGVKSYWINAFCSPWVTWERMIVEFLEAKHSIEQLKVVVNTRFGELWEERSDIGDEKLFLDRRERYKADLPDGVLCLTCGVDTQDDRLEYEIVGHGRSGENWGIKRGYIMGKPNSDAVWESLDALLNRNWRFENGKPLKIAATFIDSGGHFTQEVYLRCRERVANRVYPIKGRGGESVPYVSKPNKVPVKDNLQYMVWLYTIGVDAGKTEIMNNLAVTKHGPGYCHFPENVDAGYDFQYFNGLLSEKLTLVENKYGNKRFMWTRIVGHPHNEPLDCRNYAMAAVKLLNPDYDGLEEQITGVKKKKPDPKPVVKKPKQTRTSRRVMTFSDW